ncbi:MAG: MTH1187 family thiamine-binding protein [Syntrophobacteria bacterium]
MGILVDFSIFPTDKGESVGEYVTRVVKIIRDSGLAYSLGPMGTTIEGEWQTVMPTLTRCFEELEKDCNRIYLTIKADYRKGIANRIQEKVSAVESRL